MYIQPCPFCGWNKCKLTSKRNGGNVRIGSKYQVMCGRCYARGPMFSSNDQHPAWWNHNKNERNATEAMDLAIEAWNNRVKEG